MSYFTIEKSYLFIPFELKVKQKELLNRFLIMLENSGVGNLIQKYVKNDTELGGRPNCNYYRLFAAILYGFAFDRFTLRELEDAFQYDLRYIYLMDSIQVEGDFGIIKQNYGYTRVRRRGIEKVTTEIMLTALGLNIAKLIRFYETGKLNKYWNAPKNLEPEQFKKPSWKRLAKKGIKINKAQYETK